MNECDQPHLWLYIWPEETMEDWDLEMLEKVVQSKQTEYNQNKPTEIVSLFGAFKA